MARPSKKNVVKEEKAMTQPVNVLNDAVAGVKLEEAAEKILEEETAVVEDAEEIAKEEAAEAKKATEKKPRAKKETAKTAVKKEDVTEKKIYVQYAGNEYDVAGIEEKVKKSWEEEGHRASSIKKLDLYIKPEEAKAYYVINGKNAGSVEL